MHLSPLDVITVCWRFENSNTLNLLNVYIPKYINCDHFKRHGRGRSGDYHTTGSNITISLQVIHHPLDIWYSILLLTLNSQLLKLYIHFLVRSSYYIICRLRLLQAFTFDVFHFSIVISFYKIAKPQPTAWVWCRMGCNYRFEREESRRSNCHIIENSC